MNYFKIHGFGISFQMTQLVVNKKTICFQVTHYSLTNIFMLGCGFFIKKS